MTTSIQWFFFPSQTIIMNREHQMYPFHPLRQAVSLCFFCACICQQSTLFLLVAYTHTYTYTEYTHIPTTAKNNLIANARLWHQILGKSLDVLILTKYCHNMNGSHTQRYIQYIYIYRHNIIDYMMCAMVKRLIIQQYGRMLGDQSFNTDMCVYIYTSLVKIPIIVVRRMTQDDHTILTMTLI